MNTTGLKYFVYVAQSDSITKAAQALYITQPALSRHLQRLESELGVRLFEREHGKLSCRLTETGKLCLKDAKQIIFSEERLLNTVQKQMVVESGSLNIGYCGSEAYWLYELVSRVQKHYPQIKINAKNLSVGKLKRGAFDGSLDLVYLDGKPQEPQLKAMTLVQGVREIMVSCNHSLANRTSVKPQELVRETFISWPQDTYPDIYNWFHEICSREGVEPSVICYEDTEMVFSSVYSGMGFAVSASAYPQKLDENLFRKIAICADNGSDLWEMELNLVWNRNNNNPCLPVVLKEAQKLIHETKKIN